MQRRPRTTPRKKPRQERSRATVDAILDATARVLVQTGYDKCSTNRVALAAGVSVGSLYQYYPSKEALVAALADRHTEQMMEILRARVAVCIQEPLEKGAPALVRAVFEAHMVDARLHKVLMEQVPRVGRLERVSGVEQETITLIRDSLLLRRDEVRVKDAETAAFVLVYAVEGVVHAGVLCDCDAEKTEAITKELAEMVVRYLRG